MNDFNHIVESMNKLRGSYRSLDGLLRELVEEEIEQELGDEFEEMESPDDTTEQTSLEQLEKALSEYEYEYEVKPTSAVRSKVVVKTDERQEAFDVLSGKLSELGYAHSGFGTYGSSFGRWTKVDSRLGSVDVFIKPKSKAAPQAAGKDYEDTLAQTISDKFSSYGIEVETAGFGHGSDLIIKSPAGGEMKIEAKTNLGADFGQFRMAYDIQQQTWKVVKTKMFLKKSPQMQELLLNSFREDLRPYLDKYCTFPNLEDERLNAKNGFVYGLNPHPGTGQIKAELQSAWFQNSAQLLAPVDFINIVGYYVDKGDNFLQIRGAGLYALTPDAAAMVNAPQFAETGLISNLRFRFKPHGSTNDRHSFTAAVKIKGSLQKSNISLDNPEDHDKILAQLISK